jgi:hypothetical protein
VGYRKTLLVILDKFYQRDIYMQRDSDLTNTKASRQKIWWFWWLQKSEAGSRRLQLQNNVGYGRCLESQITSKAV